MLRIANTCISKSWGGLEMSALRLAGNLGARGHDVTTIVPEGSRLSTEAKRQGLRQVTVPVLTKYFDPRAAVKIKTFLKRNAVDIIQAHYSKDLWMLYPALLGWKSPRLFYISHMLFRGTTKRDVFHSLVYRELAGVITPTEIGKVCFVKGTRVPAGKVRVIHNGFDTARYNLPPRERIRIREELGITDDEVAIGCTSRIDPQKGQLELIEAVKIALRHYENLKLVIVGEPTLGEGQPYLDFLERKTSEYKIDSRVIFTGFRDDVPQVLQALDIFVMPTYEETFGNCIVEAMLSGLPCIGTDAGGPPEILEGGKVGLLVEPRSAESLARGLQTLIGNPELRQDLGRRARASAAERFNLDRVMKQIEDFYGAATAL
jgi:glycosyltransferase involved in cell wall biosynthesis